MGRPGRLGLTLRDNGFKLDIRRVDRAGVAAIPTDFDDVEGVISLGGPQNVGGPEPWLTREIDFLREAHARALPIVGICLGHQLLGAALGAEVGPMTRPEAGLLPVDIAPAGQIDTMLTGIAWSSPQFHMHSYEVKSLPKDVALLASSAGCKVQAMRAGLRSYGFQYHFECDRAMIEEYAADAKNEMHKSGLTSEELTQQCNERYEMFASLGDRLCLNIATCLIPRPIMVER
jgi:GMP synthase-like glutamine amidotransferase